MKLEQSFEVQAPIERVWSALTDIEQVVPCLPGAAVSGRNQDGSYNGTFAAKIGPTTASYSGKLVLQDADEEHHSATIQADGTGGQGGARATIVTKLEPTGTGTRVEVDTDYQITGRLARFGRGGMIEDISEHLLKQFVDNLEGSFDDNGSAPPAQAPSAEAPPTQTASAQAPSAPTPNGDSQAPEAIDVGSLVGSVIRQRLRDNTPVLIAAIAAIGALLVLVALRRRR